MAKHDPEGTSSDAVQRLESNERPTRGGSPFASLKAAPFRWLREGNPILLALLLTVLVFCTFAPCLRYGFVNFDDNVYVYENTRLQHGLSWGTIRWAFTTLDAGFWHPLTWLTLLLDHQLFGMNGAGYHLTNLLLHAANTVLLFVLLRRLTGVTWRSAFVAALFAVHPLHVEPVVWVSSRKDVLSTLFWMLTLLTYVRYAEVQSLKSKGKSQEAAPGVAHITTLATRHAPRTTHHASTFYLLSLSFFLCGLMSKTMVVTLPFILLLLDWWPLRRLQLKTQDSRLKTLSALFLEKLPFLAGAVVCSLRTVRAEQVVGAMHTISDVPTLDRIANAILGCWGYLVQMVWPSGLTVFYPYPRAFALWRVLGAGLVLLLASALVLLASRRRPYLAFGWIWYGVTLLPVVGLIQVGSHSHADRYAYVPLIGIFMLLVWGSCDMTRRWPHPAGILSAAAGIVLVLLLPLSRRQLGYWKDSESLFRHALAVTENNHFAHNSLGLARLEEKKLDEAIAQFNEALAIEPSYSRPRNNLGIALLEKGQVDGAITQFRAALEHRPDFAEVSYNLGVALLRKGQPQEAIAPFQQAVANRPDAAKAHYGLGSALLRTGRTTEAIVQFQKTLELDPDYAEGHSDLGLALLRLDKVDEAITQFEQALKIRPDSAEASYNLGISLLRKARLKEAIPYLQKAVALQPGFAEAQSELGNAFLRLGKVDEAIVHFQKAVQANPKLATAQNDLATALLHQGRAEEAIAHFRAATDVQPGNPFPLNNLAWALATCPQASVRDGPRAVELAQQAERLSGGRNPSVLETLAAAYAETGRFPEAIATAQRALDLATARTNSALMEPLRAQIALYRAGSPFRDSGPTNTAPKLDRSSPGSQ